VIALVLHASNSLLKPRKILVLPPVARCDMKLWSIRHLLALAWLVGAVVCYLLSFQTSAAILFFAGAILELIFWIRIGFGRRHIN
jgi:predicted membrane metal-binding protein